MCYMDVSYYHAECGGKLSDTGLHSRGKSLWRCSSCGFTGFPYRDMDIEGIDDGGISPVRIQMEDKIVCFLYLLDTRGRRVILKISEDEESVD